MPRPGVDVELVEEVYPGAAALDTGQALMIGKSSKGSATKAVEVRSLTDYELKFGPRSGGSLLYDGVSSFFSEGGGNLKVSRIVGAGAAVAQANVGTGLIAKAIGPGVWGNDIDVRADQPAGGGVDDRVFVILYNDVEVDRSYKVSTPAEAISWSVGRSWIEFTQGAGSGMPTAASTTPLTGGVDGAAAVLADAEAALARFSYSLGPGQVLAPGMTDADTHAAVCRHCDNNFRVCLLDLTDTASATTLAAALDAIRAKGVKARNALVLGTWLLYPYIGTDTTVQVPLSGPQAGMIARVDRLGDPSQAAAGSNGISRLALGLAREYTDADRENLNNLGIAMAKEIYGQVRTYGYRTGAGVEERNWKFFQESRVVMGIAHECDAAMEEFVHNTIDGHGHLFAKVETALVGICQEYYLANALFGDSPEEAFKVDTASVNTEETIENGEVHATVKVKTSRMAEWVKINLVKTPIERTF